MWLVVGVPAATDFGNFGHHFFLGAVFRVSVSKGKVGSTAVPA